MRTMKHIRALILLAFIAVVAVVGFSDLAPAPVEVPRAEASMAAYRAALVTAFTNGLTAGERNAIADAFVTEYTTEWQKRLRDGVYTDTPANRGQFYIDKQVDYAREIHKAHRRKTDLNAVPMPTPLP